MKSNNNAMENTCQVCAKSILRILSVNISKILLESFFRRTVISTFWKECRNLSWPKRFKIKSSKPLYSIWCLVKNKSGKFIFSLRSPSKVNYLFIFNLNIFFKRMCLYLISIILLLSEVWMRTRLNYKFITDALYSKNGNKISSVDKVSSAS